MYNVAIQNGNMYTSYTVQQMLVNMKLRKNYRDDNPSIKNNKRQLQTIRL